MEKTALAYGHYKMAVEQVQYYGPNGASSTEFIGDEANMIRHMARVVEFLTAAIMVLEGGK